MVTSLSCSSYKNLLKSAARRVEWSTTFSFGFSSESLTLSGTGTESLLFSRLRWFGSTLFRRWRLPSTEYLCEAELLKRELNLFCWTGDEKVFTSWKKSSSAALYRLPRAPTIWPATPVCTGKLARLRDSWLFDNYEFLWFEPPLNLCHIIFLKF